MQPSPAVPPTIEQLGVLKATATIESMFLNLEDFFLGSYIVLYLYGRNRKQTEGEFEDLVGRARVL